MNEEEKKNEPVVYRGDQITSPINKSNPKQGDPCHTLADDDRNYVVYENHRQDARFKPVGETCIAVSQLWGTGGNNQPMVLEGNGSRSSHHGDGFAESETMYTLNTVEVHAVVDPKTYQETSGTLSGGAHASGFNGQDANNDMLVSHPVVRRLTPLEAERLQGFPDGWTDIGDWKDTQGKKHKASDAPPLSRFRQLAGAPVLAMARGAHSGRVEEGRRGRSHDGESLRRHRRIPAGIPETGMQTSLGVGDRGVSDSRHQDTFPRRGGRQ